jgi:hypothetical protein
VVLTIRGSKSGRLLPQPPMKMAASGTRHCVNVVQTCILRGESTTVRVHLTLFFPHRKSEQRGFAQHTIIAPRSTWAHHVLCRLPRNSGRANRCGHSFLYSSPLPRSVVPTALTCTTMGMSSIALNTTHVTNVYDTDSWD